MIQLTTPSGTEIAASTGKSISSAVNRLETPVYRREQKNCNLRKNNSASNVSKPFKEKTKIKTFNECGRTTTT